MYLVTVVCKRDLDQMLLQAESIQKFLEPCTHWVVINDPDPDLSFWQSKLEPYYNKHNLKFYVPDWKLLRGTGWDKQQIYKYTISKFLDDDYVILDAKNFFIKPCKLEDWKEIQGCGFMQELKEGWANTSKFYSRKLNVPYRSSSLSIQTPFVFKLSVIKTVSDIDTIKQLLDPASHMPSEFLLYSYLVDNPQKTKYKHQTYWPQDSNLEMDNQFKNLSDNIVVLGLHRKFLKKLNNHQITYINEYLESLGLENKLKNTIDL